MKSAGTQGTIFYWEDLAVVVAVCVFNFSSQEATLSVISPFVFLPQSRKHASKVRLYYMLHPRDGGCPAKRLRAENVSIWDHMMSLVICYEFCRCNNCRCVQLSAKAKRVEIMFISRPRYRGEWFLCVGLLFLCYQNLLIPVGSWWCFSGTLQRKKVQRCWDRASRGDRETGPPKTKCGKTRPKGQNCQKYQMFCSLHIWFFCWVEWNVGLLIYNEDCMPSAERQTLCRIVFFDQWLPLP